MERMINIGGVDTRMVANAATPRVYRALFQSDLFSDLSHAIEDGELREVSVIEQLAYTLGRQGGSIEKETTIDEWLGTIEDPMGLVNAAGNILGLWAGNRQTTSESKKKSGQLTAR